MSAYLRESEDEATYIELQQAIGSGEVILFAGAGLSAQAQADDGRHPPLWAGLLQGMVEWGLRNRLLDEDYAREILLLINGGYLMDAGQEIEEALEQSDLQRCLYEVLLCEEVKAGEAHSLVVQLPFRAFVTTNYDELIEIAFHREKRLGLRKFYETTIDGATASFREKRAFILKAHGDVADPKSIVLGNRAFDRLLYSSNPYRSGLEMIFAMSPVLFLGFGGADPDLEAVLNRVASFNGRSKRHWMLVPAGSLPPLRAKRMWSDKGICVIQYPADAMHSGLVRFLRKLVKPPSVTPIAVPGRSTTMRKLDSIEDL